MMDDYLPRQNGKTFALKQHQQSALENLEKMREQGESIALLYHATGAGKTVTAVSDAKKMGQRTLFLAHTSHDFFSYSAEKAKDNLELSTIFFRISNNEKEQNLPFFRLLI